MGGWFGRGVIKKFDQMEGWANFEGGQKLSDFSHRFLHRFWGRFGFPFWIKNHVFFDDFLHQFPSFDFYVIIDVFWSVFGPLDIPK